MAWRQSNKFTIVVAAGLLAAGSAGAAEAPRLRYAEAVVPAWEAATGPAVRQAGAMRGGTLRFAAFGRDFAIRLEPHPGLPATAGDELIGRGELPGWPGSWARITRRGRDLTGIFSDGREWFAIEPAASAGIFLDPASPLPAGHNLVYRLADLEVDAGTLACGLGSPGGRVSAAAAMTALAEEIETPAMAAAAGPLRRVTMAPVADREFANRYGAAAAGQVLTRLNVVDGIFREQVGIDIAAGTPEIVAGETGEPFTATAASDLLGQISDYREEFHRSIGLTHLFTGKRLDNNLAGIAWQGAVCFSREGAALSTSAGLTETLSALVAAHELGHNFGAPHDGEIGSPCSLTPETFLMAVRVPNNPTFSTCSLQQMGALIEERARSNPSCLSTLRENDVALLAPDGVQAEPGELAAIALTVQNLGTRDAATVALRLQLPSALTVQSFEPDRGSCTLVTGGLDCELGTLAAESAWGLSLQVQSDRAASYSVTAEATATPDEQLANNSARFSVTIGSASQGSGGGGGGPDTLLAAILAAGAAWRQRHGPRRAASTETRS